MRPRPAALLLRIEPTLEKRPHHFRFARNNIVLNGERHGLVGDFRGSEFCGATFSPDGQWLFVNAQEPGIRFAITGPWERGAL